MRNGSRAGVSVLFVPPTSGASQLMGLLLQLVPGGGVPEMAAAAAIELAAREQGALAASAAISPSSSLRGVDVSVSATNTMTKSSIFSDGEAAFDACGM